MEMPHFKTQRVCINFSCRENFKMEMTPRDNEDHHETEAFDLEADKPARKEAVERAVGCACTLIKPVRRLIPLATSMAILVDQGLDGNQAYVYWSYGYDPNSDFNKWASQQPECIEDPSSCQSISHLYFVFSMVTWFTAPLLAAGVYGYFRGNPRLGFFGEQDDGFLELPILEAVGEYVDGLHFCLKAPLMVVVLPIVNYTIGGVFVYLLIPFASFKVGIKTLWNGPDAIDEDEEVLGSHFDTFDAKYMPGHKLWENLGEAVPQATIGLVFLCNNYTFVEGFGSAAVTITSICFSFASIAYGMYSGCKAGCK